METVEPIEHMRHICQNLRQDGRCIRLVPTMGALHAGHGSLIASARSNDANGKKIAVIVSIFVNPTQFNNPDDFQKYPSTLEDDLKYCQSLKVDYVFVPRCHELFLSREATGRSLSDQCKVCPPYELANELEGKSRPGHFEGVLTVVNKLFNITQPHEAYFGEKDYQQLVLVTRMTRDLSMGISIHPVATVRDDSDRLPLSSRNVRLTRRERKLAPIMHRILEQARDSVQSVSRRQPKGAAIRPAERDVEHHMEIVILSSMMATLFLELDKEDDELFKVDYLEMRCAAELGRIRFDEDIEAYDCLNGCVRTRLSSSTKSRALEARLLISVVVGDVRMLDNIGVLLNESSDP